MILTGTQLGIGGAIALVASAIILSARVKKEDIPKCYNAVSNAAEAAAKKGKVFDLINKMKN